MLLFTHHIYFIINFLFNPQKLLSFFIFKILKGKQMGMNELMNSRNINDPLMASMAAASIQYSQ